MFRFIHFTDAANLGVILSEGIKPQGMAFDCGPRIFMDVLVEDKTARYNGWLHVLWGDDRQGLSNVESTAAVVIELEAHEVVYVGQWGWPMPEEDGPSLHLESTYEEEWEACKTGQIKGVHMAKTTAGHFSDVVTKAVRKIRGSLPGYTGGVYEFVLGKWRDEYIDNKDRKKEARGRFRDETRPYDYYWLGSGFEVNVLHDIPPKCILGHKVFKAKTEMEDDWYRDADFASPASQ